MLNNVNNKKYTLKYIEEKIKHKNLNDSSNNNLLNFNNNKNTSPINSFSKIYNKNSSYLNKVNNVLKNEKSNKNKSNKKIMSNDNNVKVNIIEKEKDNNDINGYKINNLSSSFNNNFTNIKTNKIVFIDLKNNNDIIKDHNNDNQNEYKLNLNEKYLKNLGNNDSTSNNKIIIKSSRNKNQNDKNLNVGKFNINNYHHSTFSKQNNNNNNNNNNINDLEENKENKHFKFTNLLIQKLDEQNSNNNNNSIFIDKNIKNNFEDKQNNKNYLKELKNSKNLTNKELSFYILSKSPILRFCERMIISGGTSKLRNILSKETILNDNKKILENKINELKEKIVLCDKILDTPFTASKTADITLNFITSFQELEFKEFPILMYNDEEKKYYLTYIKILYYLLNEEIENNKEESNSLDKDNILFLRNNLYLKLSNKGYKSIRDYLYNVYIKKKDEIKEIPKIVKINYLLSQCKNKNKNLFEIKTLKICKFISFTIYLIKEIITFGNNIKSTLELKRKAKNVIDIVMKKLDKYKK